MTKQKVLVLTTTFPRWDGDSAPMFIFDFCRNISSLGWETFVLAPHHARAKRTETLEGVKVYRFPYFFPARLQRLAYGGGIPSNLERSRLARLQAPLLFFSMVFHAAWIIKREKIDVVHSHWIIPNGLAGSLCRQLFGVRHVTTMHGADISSLERIPYSKRIAAYVVSNSDAITAVSRYLADRLKLLERDSAKKMEIIPMGVELEFFSRDVNPDKVRDEYGIKAKNVLLFIGRIVEKKGLEYLILAMPSILSDNPDTQLIVCGDGPLRHECENLVSRLGLEKSVIFTGYVNGKRKRDYLSLSDVLVVPSIVADNGDTEGLPVVVLEGLATGKTVIASNVGGVSDALKDGLNGLLIKQKDAVDIAKKVKIALSDRSMRLRFAVEGRKSVEEKFSWRFIAKKYERCYRDERSGIRGKP